jgi:hypothetical protein
MVRTPISRPVQSLAAGLRKKDWWLQSCCTMNSRTRKAAAGTASNSASHHRPNTVATQAAVQIAARGAALMTISRIERAWLGRW